MMFSLPILIRKFGFWAIFFHFKILKVSYSSYFWQRLSLTDDLRDIPLNFWNITRRPIKWDDVLITRINLKICISSSFPSIHESKCFVFFLSFVEMIFKGWPTRWPVGFSYITRRPLKWDAVLITRNNSKICVLGFFFQFKSLKVS